jgi:hypothetical protein
MPETKAAPKGEELPKFVMPDTSKGINLAAKYPLYDGGDGRLVKVGHKGPPIHGLALGIIDLPSNQKDETTGEIKDWKVMVIELIQPAPACDSGEDAETFVRPAGTRIGLTLSAALLSNDKFSRIAHDPNVVCEVLIKPEMSRSKSHNRPLWIYTDFVVFNPRPRDRNKHSVNAEAFLDAMLGTAPQLTAHNGAPFKASETSAAS